MSTKTTCEQTVAIADMHDVIFATIGILDTTCETIAPNLKVMFCVSTNRSDSCRSGRHVNLSNVLHGNGKETVRIIVAKILFGGEGRTAQVGKRADGVGVETRCVKTLLIERHVLVAVDNRLLDALDLNLFEFFVRQCQDVYLFAHETPFTIVWRRANLPANCASAYLSACR